MNEIQKAYPNEIPEPLDVHVTNWTHNPLSYGSYSALPIGFTNHMWKEVKANIGKLYFSGEHTSEKYSASVQGAFEAGIDSANGILKEIETMNSTKIDINSGKNIHVTHCLELMVSFLAVFHKLIICNFNE